MEEGLKLQGSLEIILKDKDGNIKEQRSIKNLVVNTGLTYLVTAMSYPNTLSPFNRVAIGTGTASPSAGNTALQAEIARNTFGLYITNVASWQGQSEFAAGVGTGTISEAGIFNAPTGGTMFSRTSFTPIVKHSSDSLLITWTINFASA